MVTKQEIDFSAYTQPTQPVQLSVTGWILVRLLRFLKPNTVAYKLDFFERMLNFMKIIGLEVLANHLDSHNLEWEEHETGQNRSLMEFLYHFELIQKQNGRWVPREEYQTILKEHTVHKLFRGQVVSDKGLTNIVRKQVRDFLFVRDLIKKYNNPEHAFRHIRSHKHHWEKLVNSKQLDYEVRLCETLFNLKDFQLNSKIKSPFDEAYYTESGQNAFRNFTRFAFLNYLKDLDKKDDMQVFDLGCGYGNYIEAVLGAYSKASVTGMELNPKVYAKTRKKFERIESITLLNQNFFDYAPDQKYDLILMNYVLFYFNAEEKRKVMEKAREMLSDSGSIVVCQYFSGLEDLKSVVARKQHDYSLSNKIELYYSDKILYANTLWNDSVDTFSEAVQWDEFQNLLSLSGLQITSMVHADKFYYSFFIELKKIY